LFEEVAELGVRAVLVESWLALDAPGPKMEWGLPEGVEFRRFRGAGLALALAKGETGVERSVKRGLFGLMKISILAVASVCLGEAGEEETAVGRGLGGNACFLQTQLLEYR
jgi:hypothetical protein